MPWREVSIVSERREFVMLAVQEGANKRALCRRWQVGPRIGYKWLRRFEAGGETALADRSRRPLTSPGRTAAEIEEKVVALRREHPCWGGRKLRQRLLDLDEPKVPSASTITAILRRHGLLEVAGTAAPRPLQRFERAAPNELWQMDFKGHFATGAGRCHPLTVLDDQGAAERGRVDLAVARVASISRAHAQRLIGDGRATVDGRRARSSDRLVGGERITVELTPQVDRTIVPEQIPLTIAYEDATMLIVDKPAGLVVHPSAGHATGTLVHALLGRAEARGERLGRDRRRRAARDRASARQGHLGAAAGGEDRCCAGEPDAAVRRACDREGVPRPRPRRRAGDPRPGRGADRP